MSWRHYVDLVTANLEGKLEKAALTIQTGLDKAERTLQTSLADSRRDQQTALAEAEKRVNEKFESLMTSADKTEKAFGQRLDQQDVTINRIDRERTLYVTRDQLDLILKSVNADIRPLERGAMRLGGGAVVLGAFIISVLVPMLLILFERLISR